MRRREFFTLLGGAAAWPLRARAQQAGGMRRIGVLTGLTGDDPRSNARLAALRQGLEKLGWSQGRNVTIDYRFAPGGSNQEQTKAKDLVGLRPDVILAQSTPIVAALQRESRKIPIVFVTVSDPIGSGFVTTLGRPGGNLTGLLMHEDGIIGKWLAMLKEIAPHLKHAALVANPKTTPFAYFQGSARAAVSALAIELVPSPVNSRAEIERVIETFSRMPIGGIVLPPDTMTFVNRDLVVARSPHGTACLRYTRSDRSSRPVDLCPTASTSSTYSGRRRPTSIVFFAAPNRPICRSRRRPNTKPLSI